MALLFMDGFEGYGISSTPAGMVLRWPGTSTSNLTIVAGRLTGYCIQQITTGTFITPALTTNATLIVGCAALFQNTTNTWSISLYDGATLGINITLSAAVPSTVVTKLGAGVIDTTTIPIVFRINTWYYIELKVYCDATVGTIEVRINGATVVALTNQNTKAGAHSYHNIVRFSLNYTTLDDVYICDGSTAPNDFQGVCKVLGLFPNADTATIDWTPSTGSTHYNLVDENPYNTTDYVSSSTSTNTDLYTYPSLVGTGTIIGIQVNTIAELFAGTSIILESPIVSNGNTDLGADTTLLSASYLETRHISVTDPNTSSAWTIANLAAAQIGVKVM